MKNKKVFALVGHDVENEGPVEYIYALYTTEKKAKNSLDMLAEELAEDTPNPVWYSIEEYYVQ